MDIRSLQQVIAVRKHGSFAKAADALGVSQPNLSKSVARLEDELKLKIFDRTAKGSVLTPVGELIVERADAVIAETRDLRRATPRGSAARQPLLLLLAPVDGETGDRADRLHDSPHDAGTPASELMVRLRRAPGCTPASEFMVQTAGERSGRAAA